MNWRWLVKDTSFDAISKVVLMVVMIALAVVTMCGAVIVVKITYEALTKPKPGITDGR
jgi:amino acid permease